METTDKIKNSTWTGRAHRLGSEFAEHAARHDEDGTFVVESFDALKEEGLLAAIIPEQLGGGGATFAELCDFIRIIAHYDASTALAYSMHSHLVAATVFKYKKGQPGEALLKKVADQKLLLISTGAGDWLESNGTMTKVEGGFLFSAKKTFASGSPVGDLMLTSGRYDDPAEGPQVLHFPLSFATQGVSRESDWDTHGMRGTGSSTVTIKEAFIPEQSIAMRRERGPYHPAFFVICTVALPIIASVYVGIAEKAVEIAIANAKKRRDDPNVQYLAGELLTELYVARACLRAMVDGCNELDFVPEFERASRGAEGKTSVAQAAVRIVDKAMELAGGEGYFKKTGLERLRRDVAAAQYHPLQPKRQHLFTGRGTLGLSLT